jgi:hypothetical protein
LAVGRQHSRNRIFDHIEIDVGNTHENKSIPVESIQIRTGGSLSFSHAVSLNSIWGLNFDAI